MSGLERGVLVLKRALGTPVARVTLIVLAAVGTVALLYTQPWMPDYLFPLVMLAALAGVVTVGVKADLDRMRELEDGGAHTVPTAVEHGRAAQPQGAGESEAGLRIQPVDAAVDMLVVKLPIHSVTIVTQGTMQYVLIPLRELMPVVQSIVDAQPREREERPQVVLVPVRQDGEAKSLLGLLRW
ncbi:MAG: hypothetical protein QXU69_03390 [Thermofilaceae archaeon]